MIKTAIIQDITRIMEILILNSNTFTDTEIQQAKQNILQLIYNKSYYVFIYNNTIIGCIGFSKEQVSEGVYCLNWLAIDPRYKRQKIATKLYNYIESKLKKENARLIILNAGSNEDNIFFYKNIGFSIGGTIPKYYNKEKDLIWYYKEFE